MALSKIVENSITDGVVSSAKLKDFAAAVDLNGVELILDADQDTSITADTDDRIDFKLGGVEHISLNNSSGDTVIKPMVDAKDIIFQQYDGNKILEINDGNYVGIGGNASAPGEIRIYEDTDNGSHYTGFKAGNNTASVSYVLPTADGSASQSLITDGSGTLSWSTISSAADDLTAGDAAINLTTTAGNITIDAQGNDTDIIFKGTDGGADTTYMTIDGSAGGDLFLTGGLIDLKNDGSAVSQIKFYCESSNAHAQTLIGAPHSESATNTLTLPSTGGNSYLLTAASTATVTNKTFTSPKINEDVAVTTTATEINLIDGGTSRGTTALASGDGILINDAGTMRMTNVDTVKTFMQTGISTAYDDLTAGDAAVTITTSSGNITIDAAADDSDIIFKGTDGGADTTFLTIDGSAAGLATFNAGVVATTGTFSGVVDADAGITVDNITIDGTEIDLSSGDLTIDVAGDIHLDADGGDILFKDGGTTFATHTLTSGDYKITVPDDIFFNVAGASDNILGLYGNDSSNANTQVKVGTHLYPLADNASDLGNSSERWKDLYLSGGLKVGGTGSANTLSDYETGTWTPSITATNGGSSMTYSTSNSGSYIKIGDQVTVFGMMQLTAKGNLQSGVLLLKGFPFNISSVAHEGQGGVITEYANFSVNFNSPILAKTTTERMLIRYTSADGSSTYQNATGNDVGNDTYIRFFATYGV